MNANEPAVVTPSPEPEPTVTLAEHRDQFPAPRVRNAELPPRINGTSEAPAPTGPTPPKHRAKSNQARPDDLAEINKLTRSLRETEQTIPLELTREAGESERTFDLRRRAAIAKLAAEAAAAKKKAAGSGAAPPVPAMANQVGAPPASPASGAPPAISPASQALVNTPLPPFQEPQPPRTAFQTDADWYRALAMWDRRKERWDEGVAQQALQARAQYEEFDRQMITGMQSHVQRVRAFSGSRPDVQALFDAEAAKPEAEQIPLTLAMRGAIEFDERGPEMIVTLLQHPDLADELFLLTNGRPVGDPRSDSLVATVRRRLLQRAAAVGTGAAPSRIPVIAPHPPTPVRTATPTPREKAATDPPGSLREHRAMFPPQRRH